MSSRAGRLLRLYRVMCVKCHLEEESTPGIGAKGTAAWSLRQRGWSRTKHGWTCESCKEEVVNGKRQDPAGQSSENH